MGAMDQNLHMAESPERSNTSLRGLMGWRHPGLNHK